MSTIKKKHPIVENRAWVIYNRPMPNSRSIEVQAILEQDHKAFEEYVANLPVKPNAVPASALRYLIPHKFLELVKNPSQVTLAIQDSTKTSATFYIVDKDPIGYPPRTDIPEIIQERARYISRDPDAFEAELEDLIIYYEEIRNRGEIGIEDELALSIFISFHRNQEINTLYVIEYMDRPHLRGKGIASSFYNQLRPFAKALGFGAIAGHNERKNIDYFISKQGRVTLDKIRPGARHLFSPYYEGPFAEDLNYVTIEFLSPEDKTRFLKRK